ncbi:hypothetical protein FLGE108171_11750 [Flavobacterium gelidilacus]|uniref:hypothetical protein n=1 Tax=Flavobacterium gelidilacus TaxID=206041 RepID=UPI000687A7F7|nr:hypothetical protein [Flavobacterium gelidilacus]
MESTIDVLRRKSDWLMTTLKVHPKKEATWQITVNFANYACLCGTIADLMKVCSAVLQSEEPYVSSLVENPAIDVANILELAVQLMPHSEAEFLDEVRQVLNEESIEQLPAFNYSKEVVLEKKAS